MKRVLRIMQNHGLTLERHTARRPGRTHDGVIVALRSNRRWCSDHLEIHARGEVVRVPFVIDACDREIIAWSAVANAGVSGELVRDLMVAAVEHLFGASRTPHRLEWLSDKASSHFRARHHEDSELSRHRHTGALGSDRLDQLQSPAPPGARPLVQRPRMN